MLTAVAILATALGSGTLQRAALLDIIATSTSIKDASKQEHEAVTRSIAGTDFGLSNSDLVNTHKATFGSRRHCVQVTNHTSVSLY